MLNGLNSHARYHRLQDWRPWSRGQVHLHLPRVLRRNLKMMDAQITSNTFCTYTATPAEATTTVFFISGNPGLIGYYHPFLSLLGRYLANSQDPSSALEPGKEIDTSSVQIYGCSLGGFEINRQEPASTTSKHVPRHDKSPKLFDLEDQIDYVHDKLNTLMSQNASSTKGASQPSTRRKVILMGHSVGAYIGMEVLRRHREANDSSPHSGYTVDFDIIGGVMLFPTVKDIAHSPSGQKLTVRRVNPRLASRRKINVDIDHPRIQTLLSIIPQLALVVSFFARLLTTLLPTTALKALVKLVMHHPPPHALDTTTSFLQSPRGVRQAL